MQAIVEALRNVERENGVRVLYACESGSRAWGFASPDSDFDVRFIYVHDRDYYLSIESNRDVIEAMLPGDLDLAGWDLRKTLYLLRKSNPSLIEWIHSPIVYAEVAGFSDALNALADQYYSPARGFRHYLHMAQGNWAAYLQEDLVSYKKYLYVLRPILACLWIEKFGSPPPMEFDALRAATIADHPVNRAIDSLLELKRNSPEVGKGSRIEDIHRFLADQIARIEAIKTENLPPLPVEPLNEFFRKWLPEDL
jgi:predicted nucleotidyltransferase